MSYQDFLTQWLGKEYEESTADWYQCVALVKLYIEQVDWIQLGWFGGTAFNGWETGSPFDSNWERVLNSPTAIPPLWAVVFFKPYAADPAGHVAIAAEGCTSTQLNVIEQNAGNGNGDGKVSDGNCIRLHTYNYETPVCLWWFMYK